MQYTAGKIGRVFVLRFEHDDDFNACLEAFCRRERLRSGFFFFLGALARGKLVTGPRKPVIPPQPNWVGFQGGWEILGVGSVFGNASGPQIHIHTSMGKKRRVLTGCVRKQARVFSVIEAIVLELKGVRLTKELDPATGLNLLRIVSGLRTVRVPG